MLVAEGTWVRGAESLVLRHQDAGDGSACSARVDADAIRHGDCGMFTHERVSWVENAVLTV